MLRFIAILLACVCAAAAADPTGNWNVKATSSSGEEYQLQLVVKNEGGQLSGTMDTPGGTVPLEDVKLSGDELSYKISVGSGYLVKFTVGEKTMKGTYKGTDGSTGTTEATRAVSSAGGK